MQKGVVKINLGMLGNTDVGKTSLSRKFAKGESADPKAKNLKTSGIDMQHIFLKVDLKMILKKELEENGAEGINVDDNVIRLSIWDTGG
jgi:GTPase SAR1 family protein